jgi:hypothetical protein
MKLFKTKEIKSWIEARNFYWIASTQNTPSEHVFFYRRRSAPISSADDVSKNCQHKRSLRTLTQSALSTQFVWSTMLLRKHNTIELHINYGNSS